MAGSRAVRHLGAAISIAFLLALGSLNLAAVLATAPHEMVQPVGLKENFWDACVTPATPALVAGSAPFRPVLRHPLPGRLLRFRRGLLRGWTHALGLALLFLLGMLLTDGINGAWIARLIARADEVALIASRVMGLVVSGIACWSPPLTCPSAFADRRGLERREGACGRRPVARVYRRQLPACIAPRPAAGRF